MKNKNQLIWALFIVALLSACDNNKEPQNDHIVADKFCLDDSFKSKISLEQSIKKPVTEGIHLTGAVEPNPDKVIHFISLVGGIISKTYFSLGDKVNEGQVLAELKSTELSSLQAEQKNLTSQAKVAQKKLDAIQAMYSDGISSEKDLIEAQTDLDIIEADLEKVRAYLSLFSASEEKGVFQIKAPASGIITEKSITAGSQISAEGESLFTISDLSQVWVMVNIYASNVTSIKENMPVEIKTLSYPDETFKGSITAISQVYDDEARVLKARVVLPNDNIKLKPGMLVDVMASKESNTEAVSISTESIVFDNNQNFVIAYTSDCDLTIKKVEILTKNSGLTFIASGLQEGEKILSKNQLLIYEQLKNFQN